jgi:hypothetical protein
MNHETTKFQTALLGFGVAAITAEVDGRTSWTGRKCNVRCPGCINSKEGSKKKAANHAKDLAGKAVYLGKYIALMKAGCRDE